MFRGEGFRIFLAVSTLSFFTITFFLRYQNPLEVYPNNETLFEYGAYSDDHNIYNSGYKESGGVHEESYVKVDTLKGRIRFTYKLNPESSHPHAMLLYHAQELDRTVDLTKYRYLNLQIDSCETDEFLLSLYMYVPNFTNRADIKTHRPYSYIFSAKNDGENFHIPLSDFATPVWWYELNNTHEESMPPSDWKRSTHLSISNCINAPLNEIKHVTIKKIYLVDSIFIEGLISLLISIGYLIIVLVAKKLIPNNKLAKSIYYKENNSKVYTSAEKKALIQHIGENYSDPLLTIDSIEKKLGIKKFKINQILKENYSMSYKQYITTIRIKEAKRELINTDFPVSEIANNVGYCYSNSFIRIFKNIEGLTPTQFREKSKKSA